MATDDTGSMIETCLVCKVAWDVSLDPPKCSAADHPHALNIYSAWDKPGRGRAD